MLLSELLREVEHSTIVQDFEVSALTGDSRDAMVENSVFVCIQGFTIDGHEFAEDVLKKGARAVVVERDLGLKEQILVKNTRSAYAKMCSAYFGHPSRKMKLIGVTGTNGKTTVTGVVRDILEYNGHKTGLIGTVGNFIGDLYIPAKHTTPDPMALHALFARMVQAGCEYAVMEVSSHALDQHRLDGCMFDVAAFTNLTQDHLDYHKTMENYFEAKARLFSQCKTAIINWDDSYGRRLCERLKGTDVKLLTFSAACDAADFTAKDPRYFADGVKFAFVGKEAIERISFKMPGPFSVSNAMTAVTTAMAAGIDLPGCAAGIAACKGVRGRAEVLYSDENYTILCDYAHTPDGIQKILQACRSFCGKRRLCILFGCAGNRDAKKRPMMAAAAAQNADFVILTSDNPRREDPEKIIRDALPGFKEYKTPYVTIPDRFSAIEWAIGNMKKGDLLVLAGKGHEDYQVLDFGTVCFDERQIVERIIREQGIGSAK